MLCFFFPTLSGRVSALKTYFIFLRKHFQLSIGFLRPSFLERKSVRGSVLRKTSRFPSSRKVGIPDLGRSSKKKLGRLLVKHNYSSPQATVYSPVFERTEKRISLYLFRVLKCQKQFSCASFHII